MSRRPGILSLSAWALLVLVAVLLLLLAFPIYGTIESLERADATRAIFARKKLLVAGLGLVGMAVFAWLVWKRKVAGILACLIAGVLLAEIVVAYAFQKTFPHSNLYDSARYRASGNILLGRDAALSSVDPVPLIKLQNRSLEKAAFPVIDVHFHFESMPAGMPPSRLIEAMDAAGVEQVVNLGGVEELFEKFAREFRDAYPGRFILFIKPDPNALLRADGVEREMKWLERAASQGAQGIKENKSFGMGQRDASGKRVPVDDARLDPFWEFSGRMGWPVLIHTGEPKSFWAPVDSHNERYQELLANPSWSVHGKPDTPPFEELMAQRERLLAKHPGTNFIGAHFGMNPDDLAYAAQLLDKYPNYYLDMSSVVSELGRQPYSTRRFFVKYQDRILFGTDGGFGLEDRSGWTPERLFRSYFEWLETENEYIEYPMQSVTRQGSWRVYGIGLPPEVLEKIYRTNAQRLIPSADEVRRRYAEYAAGSAPAG